MTDLVKQKEDNIILHFDPLTVYFLCHRSVNETKRQSLQHWRGQSTFQNKKWRELDSTCGLATFPSVLYSPVSTVLGTAPATLRSDSSPWCTGNTFSYFYCEQCWMESERSERKWQRNKKKKSRCERRGKQEMGERERARNWGILPKQHTIKATREYEHCGDKLSLENKRNASMLPFTLKG